jgi:hypothetical protein
MNGSVTSKLEERGYWRVEVRPSAYVERRVLSTQVLQRAIEKARVELRGWDFPHIGRSWDLPESQDWIGVETDWSVHVEVWRAFLSGQFVYRGGVWTDWLDQHVFRGSGPDWKPRQGMPLVSSLWSITEFWEFAARYSQTEAGDDRMFAEVSFQGMKGRELFGDHERRVWFQTYGPARMNSFTFAREVSRAELIADAAKLAVTCAEELFATFGYEPARELLESIQSELLNMRRGA